MAVAESLVMDTLSNLAWLGTWLIFLLPALFHIPAYWAIKKTGWSGWWFLLLFVPPFNLAFLWILAFSPWPNEKDVPRDLAREIE